MILPLAVLGAATAGFLVYGLSADSPFVAYYVPITVALMGLGIWLNRHLRWSTPVIWGLVAIGIGNLIGGVLLVDGQPFYSYALIGELRYDKVFHAIATGVAAWAAHGPLAGRIKNPGPVGLGFLVVLVASGAGAVVEMIEYLGSVLFEQTSVGDYANNMLDLVANLIGALAAVVILGATGHDMADSVDP
jgi:uncharacterized membrane protein YjdF